MAIVSPFSIASYAVTIVFPHTAGYSRDNVASLEILAYRILRAATWIKFPPSSAPIIDTKRPLLAGCCLSQPAGWGGYGQLDMKRTGQLRCKRLVRRNANRWSSALQFCSRHKMCFRQAANISGARVRLRMAAFLNR